MPNFCFITYTYSLVDINAHLDLLTFIYKISIYVKIG